MVDDRFPAPIAGLSHVLVEDVRESRRGAQRDRLRRGVQNVFLVPIGDSVSLSAPGDDVGAGIYGDDYFPFGILVECLNDLRAGLFTVARVMATADHRYDHVDVIAGFLVARFAPTAARFR